MFSSIFVLDACGDVILSAMLTQIKSMGVHLARTGKLNGSRKARFPDQYVDDIVALHTTITKDIVDRYIRVRIAWHSACDERE